jgi:hypothetical protein
MSDRIKTVDGLLSTMKPFAREAKLDVRVDESGQTLTITSDSGIMMMIPLEPVADMLKVVDEYE